MMKPEPETRTLLAVHAHPDDESTTTGGILARSAAEGARTVLLTCTRGDVGTPDPREPTGEVRARELAEAGRILGLSRIVQLGYRDSGMAGTPMNSDPACFWRADFAEAVERVVRVIREERPRVVVTYDERGGYGHPDHIQAHRVTTAAFRVAGNPARCADVGPPWQPARLYFVTFPRARARRFAEALRASDIDAPYSAMAGVDAEGDPDEFGTPDDSVQVAVDVSAYVDVKRAALAAHRSQVGSDHFLLRTPLSLLRELWSHEYFQRAGWDPSQPAEPGADLFAGL